MKTSSLLVLTSSRGSHSPRGTKRPTDLSDQLGDLGCKSLTMSYFHTGIRTIIGAKSFHCPVRDGKEWDQLAMVIRHNGLVGCFRGNEPNS